MQGFVLYRGPSVIDGSPIAVIVTGLQDGARNTKTGPMTQIYIMRSDMNPMVAVHTGEDYSICGECRHRGTVETDPKTGLRKNVGRSCYVTLMHGPRVVYDAFQRGVYEDRTPGQARKLLAGRNVRLGAYGDPAAVPMEVWDQALDRVLKVNGYTHLWRKFPELSAFCMASCDTEEEREEAKGLGFRTFRVRTKNDPVLPGEGQCPASAELKKAVQCVQCMLCGGRRTKAKADITILAHGTGARNYEKSLA